MNAPVGARAFSSPSSAETQRRRLVIGSAVDRISPVFPVAFRIRSLHYSISSRCKPGELCPHRPRNRTLPFLWSSDRRRCRPRHGRPGGRRPRAAVRRCHTCTCVSRTVHVMPLLTASRGSSYSLPSPICWWTSISTSSPVWCTSRVSAGDASLHRPRPRRRVGGAMAVPATDKGAHLYCPLPSPFIWKGMMTCSTPTSPFPTGRMTIARAGPPISRAT